MRKAKLDGIDIVGRPKNDICIEQQASNAKLVICAWGAGAGLFNKMTNGRDQEVYETIARDTMPYALRVSQATGSPWHPLYLPGDVEATPYRRSA